MLTIFIMCPGLGHIGRGYESFSREQFDTLRDAEDFQLHLFKGAGISNKYEHSLFCLKRKSGLTKIIAKLLSVEPYTLEQFTFALSAIPWLILKRPKVILYSDFIFGVYLWYIRKFLNLKYKLLFTNGSPNGPPYSRCDHVQQLLPSHYQWGLEGGEDSKKFTLLPLGAHVPVPFEWPFKTQVETWRKELNLPLDKQIVLSVGTINKHHKRMDYLIKEFRHLDPQSYFLLIVGSPEEESEEVYQLADSLLAPSSYMFRTVPFQQMATYYLCSNLFVLCSVAEGFGRVYLEALSYGLPVYAHDYSIAREVMQHHGVYINMKQEGNLSQAIKEKMLPESTRDQKRDFVYKEYDWGVLKKKYIDLIMKVAG